MQEDLKNVSPDNSWIREYKFRVFLPKHDVTDTISMSEQMYYCDNFLKVHQATHCNSMDKINRPFYIMQYTGLKDKNGVEICEGDILEDNNGNRGVVLWFSQNVEFMLNDMNEYVNGNYEEPAHIIKDVFVIHKVVGNIHQNKDMIEEGPR